MNAIQCNIAAESYFSGVAVIYLTSNSYESFVNSTIFVQIHGYIQIDYRWLKQSLSISDSFTSPAFSFDNNLHIVDDPLAPLGVSSASALIFTSSKVPISPTNLVQKGVFVEFEIPKDALPSFKGLCVCINYFASVTVQSTTGSNTVHFPIIVNAVGCACKSYITRQTGIVAYSSSSLPAETFVSAAVYNGYSTNATDDLLTKSNNIYKICNDEYICSIFLDSSSVAPGSNMRIAFDFCGGKQKCRSVKASLILSERRSDNSRIQDKLLVSSSRGAEDAQQLLIVLNFRSDLSCSFECPVVKVCYQVDIEFSLYDVIESSADNSESSYSESSRLMFSIPITVIPPGMLGHNKSAPSALQLAHQCLAARYDSL